MDINVTGAVCGKEEKIYPFRQHGGGGVLVWLSNLYGRKINLIFQNCTQNHKKCSETLNNEYSLVIFVLEGKKNDFSTKLWINA